jgi:hypothetical protein
VNIELRGLRASTYKVVDYINQKGYSAVKGPTGKLKVNFADNLLLEATTVESSIVEAIH